MYRHKWAKKLVVSQAKVTKVIIYWLVFAILSNSYLVAQQTKSTESSTLTISSKTTTLPKMPLNRLIEQTLEHNPEIKAMQRNYDMMRARIPQAQALPDPMLSYGYLGNINPLPPFDIQKGDPSSARIISFTQELPYPGKRALRGKMAAMNAAAEWVSYEQTRLNIVAEVKMAYFEWWYINKALNTINQTRDLLEKFTKIAAARYEVGKGIQQDVLKGQVEVSRLIEQAIVLEQRKEVVEAQLNSLRYYEIESPVGVPEELAPEEFTHTLKGLNEIALANSPTLKIQKRKIDQEEYGIQLAKKDFYPDMSIGFIYQNRPNMPEMYGLTFGVKLPLYFWQKQRPALAEATASAAMQQKRFDNARVVLLYKIKEKYLAVTTAQKLSRLYGTVIIPQASLSLESAIAGYEVGKVDFLTLMDSSITLLNYELNYHEQLSNAEKAIAELEPLMGEPLK